MYSRYRPDCQNVGLVEGLKVMPLATLRRLQRPAAPSTTQSPPATAMSTRAVPTRKQVVDAIIRESVAAGTRCDAARAGRVIKLAKHVVSLGGQDYYLSTADLDVDGGPHDVLAIVVPDTEPGDELRPLVEGSAEALLTAHVMPANQPGGRLLHTSDFTETIRHCVVAMRVC